MFTLSEDSTPRALFHALISSETRSHTATARATRRNSSIFCPIRSIRRGIGHRAVTGSNQTPDHDWPCMSSSSNFGACPAIWLFRSWTVEIHHSRAASLACFSAPPSSVSATIRALSSAGQRRRPPNTGSTSTLLRVEIEVCIQTLIPAYIAAVNLKSAPQPKGGALAPHTEVHSSKLNFRFKSDLKIG